MVASLSVYLLLILLTLCAACVPALQDWIRAARTSPPPNVSASTSLVHQFPEGASNENIAVRSNGNLLVTRLDVPELYEINPRFGRASLVHRFPSATGLTGIAETARHEFVVISGHFSGSSAVQGEFRVWKVDMRNTNLFRLSSSVCSSASPTICPIADIPQGQFLNSITPLSRTQDTVLIIDPVAGCVYRVDIINGKYAKVLDDASMNPGRGLPGIGINGIKIQGGTHITQTAFSKYFAGSEFTWKEGQLLGNTR